MLRTGQLPKFEERTLQDPRGGREPAALPDPHRGGAAHRAPRRRDPRRGDPAAPLHRLHALLSPRGGHLRQGHEGHDPPAPVRQGGAGQAHHARPVLRRAGVHGGRGGRSAQAPRAPLPRGGCIARGTRASRRPRATTSRSGCRGRGSIARSRPARTARPSRRAGSTSSSGPRAAARRVLPHAQWLRARGGAHPDRGPRELPGGRRQRHVPPASARTWAGSSASRPDSQSHAEGWPSPVEGAGLENRNPARDRGFESLPLRHSPRAQADRAISSRVAGPAPVPAPFGLTTTSRRAWNGRSVLRCPTLMTVAPGSRSRSSA